MIGRVMLLTGKNYTICSLTSAEDSFNDVMAKYGDMNKAQKQTTKMYIWLKTLAEDGKLPKEAFHTRCPAKANSCKVWGLSVGSIRVYGWFSENLPKTFVISHYAYKTTPKTSDADCARVHRNYKQFEQASGGTK